MFPVCDHDSRYSVTYETLLKPALMSPEKSPVVTGHVKPETVLPPVGGNSVKTATVGCASGTAPNICIEGGRIEFVRSPTDCGGEKQDYLKVSVAEGAKVPGEKGEDKGPRGRMFRYFRIAEIKLTLINRAIGLIN